MPSAAPRRFRLSRAAPYLLMVPGLFWLLLFYVLPAAWMFVISLSTGTLATGFVLTGTLDAYVEGLTRFPVQFGNSLLYGGLATLFTFLIGFPVAYTIAFRGGRFKNLLLFLVIAPFFTSFLIRTISWKILLGDQGPILGALKDLDVLPPDFRILGSAIAVIAGITYNFLPFMILPLSVALEKIDPYLIEAANDLYANRFSALRRVTVPLALPGIFAGSLLTFIPAIGDFVTPDLLGGAETTTIAKVIQELFLEGRDWPYGAALGFILMVITLGGTLIALRPLRGEVVGS